MTDTLTSYSTPEEAAAAVRHGRQGYALCTRTPAGQWVAFEAHISTTKDEARMYARAAMAKALDPARVAVVDERGERLHVAAPRELTQAMKAAKLAKDLHGRKGARTP